DLKVPLCVHAENRQIQHYWTNKLKTEGKNDPIYWEQSRPYLCEAESISHIVFLAEAFGTKLHMVHASTKQATQTIRDAKARGLRVTAETCPHYLLREDKDMAEVGPLLKMNPPVRSKEHQDALWEGLLNGSIDMIKEMPIDPNKLHSKNKPTPWGGWKVKGVPIYTIVRGNVQMKDGEPVGKVIGQMQTPIVS